MKFIFLLLLVLLPQAVFGATDFSGFTFTPPPEDISIVYLSTIFGVVDGVLHGTGSQIIGTMFGVFNAALLAMGSVVLMYILFVSVLRTAHEGEVMGKNWSSIWIPLRVIVGIILMLPKASGYSLIQVFIMWLVVQGVGVADSVWAASLHYFERGGILVSRSQSLSNLTPDSEKTQYNARLVFSGGSILRSEVCMYTVRNALIKNQAVVGVTVPDFTSTVKVVGQTSGLSPPCYGGDDSRPECAGKTDNRGMVNFPGNVTYAGINYKGVCGSSNWPFTVLPGKGGLLVPDNTAGGLDSRSLAAQQIVLDLEPTAYSLAQKILPTAAGQSGRDLKDFDRPIGSLENSGLDYLGIIRPALNPAAAAITQEMKDTLNRAAHYGWILAGSFYFKLASLNNSYSAAESDSNRPQGLYVTGYTDPRIPVAARNALNTNVSTAKIESGADCTKPSTAFMDIFICSEFINASRREAPVPTPPPPQPPNPEGGEGGKWWNKETLGGTETYPWDKQGVQEMSDWGNAAVTRIEDLFSGISDYAMNKLKEVVYLLADKINDIWKAYLATLINSLPTAEATNVNPVIALSDLGQKILKDVEYVWLVGPFWVFGAAVLADLITCKTGGNAIQDLLAWFIPFAMMILGILFGMGMSFAYYIPLVPLIVLLFTAIGWFAAVIEAMVAGPFVALALVVPEGQHDIFGPAYNAIMLLFGLFCRPVLIVFGFILGSTMTHVGLWVFNFSLVAAITQGGLGERIQPDIAPVLGPLAMMIIYLMIVVQIVERSFALIHETPNRVLEWVGIQSKGYGEAEAIGAVKSAAAEKLGAVSQAGQKGGEGGMEFAAKMAKGKKADEGKGGVS